MKALHGVVMGALVLLAGCASTVNAKKPAAQSGVRQLGAGVSTDGKSSLSARDCIQSERVFVCREDLAQPTGKSCACVDQKRLWGQSHSLLGPE